MTKGSDAPLKITVCRIWEAVFVRASRNVEFIHLQNSLSPCQGWLLTLVKGGTHPDSRQCCRATHTPPGHFRDTNLPMKYVSELWKEAEEPEENPHLHEEHFQIQQRRVPAGIWTRGFLLWGESANHYAIVQPKNVVLFWKLSCFFSLSKILLVWLIFYTVYSYFNNPLNKLHMSL